MKDNCIRSYEDNWGSRRCVFTKNYCSGCLGYVPTKWNRNSYDETALATITHFFSEFGGKDKLLECVKQSVRGGWA
jgi:hypothetical protein